MTPSTDNMVRLAAAAAAVVSVHLDIIKDMDMAINVKATEMATTTREDMEAVDTIADMAVDTVMAVNAVMDTMNAVMDTMIVVMIAKIVDITMDMDANTERNSRLV